MTRAKRKPRVVAELGRPETPEETFLRKEENSRTYRSRKTVNNLVLSLLVTVVAAFVLVLLVPRSDTAIEPDVDYGAVAAQLQPSVDEPLANPELPAAWRSNAATWRPGANDHVPSWYIGLLTPKNGFIGLTQAFDANPTWLSQQVKDAPATDTVTIGGMEWDVYRNPAKQGDRGNFDYALVARAGASTYLLIGTASTPEFAVLANAVAENVKLNAAEGMNTR